MAKQSSVVQITTSNLTEVRKAIKNINLKNSLKGTPRVLGLSLNKLSKKLGENPNFLHYNLGSPDVKIALILALSVHTNINLLEPYSLLLPEPLQETERERTLKSQLAALQQQFEALTKERDLLKEIVMK